MSRGGIGPAEYQEIRRLSRDAVLAAIPDGHFTEWTSDPANDGRLPRFFISEPFEVSIEWNGKRYGGTFVHEATEVELRDGVFDIISEIEIQLSHRAIYLIRKESEK